MADENMLLLLMNDCVQSRNQLFPADSWTAHNHSAYDLRGIWSRPVSDPGLSVVTKHPSGSTDCIRSVKNHNATAGGTMSVETYFMRFRGQ